MQRTVKLLLLLSTSILALPACGSDANAPGDDAGAPGHDANAPGPDSGTPATDGSTPGDDDDGSVPPGDDSGPGQDGGVTSSADDVLTYHKNVTRDGVEVDALMTKDNAKKLKVDASFSAAIDGWLMAQPLYVTKGACGKATIYAATDSNNVYALDASTGAVLWKKTVAPPLTNPPAHLGGCGSVIDPLGITGTPVIDLASRSIFFDAMTTGPKHLLFALSLDDGSTKPGWPIDASTLSTTADGKQVTLDAVVHGERGALTILNGTVYVPYGGHIGDCGDYHGWVVGVPIADPSKPKMWATDSVQAGIWAPNGIASDGTSLFVATGNAHTNYNGPFKSEESLIKLGAGPTFSGATTDYFAPSNWLALDHGDTDISGTGPMVLDLPGSTPSALLVGIGKNGVMYLQDRNNLGGIGKGTGTDNEGLASKKVSNSAIINGSVAYKTAQGAYVAFKGSGNGCPAGQSGDLTAVKITPGAPPTMKVAWCAKQNGSGSPMVTTTDGTNDVIVWGLAAEGSSAVTGFDGDTGAVVVPAITTNATTHRYETTTAVHGRIIVGGEGSVVVLSPQ